MWLPIIPEAVIDSGAGVLGRKNLPRSEKQDCRHRFPARIAQGAEMRVLCRT